MALGAENRKVGVVTFNNEVTVMGDGTKNPYIITGDRLNDYDYLLKTGCEQASILLNKTVKTFTHILFLFLCLFLSMVLCVCLGYTWTSWVFMCLFLRVLCFVFVVSSWICIGIQVLFNSFTISCLFDVIGVL